jgi:hypothetical protein
LNRQDVFCLTDQLTEDSGNLTIHKGSHHVVEKVYNEQRRVTIQTLHNKQNCGASNSPSVDTGLGLGPGGAGGELWPLGTFFPPAVLAPIYYKTHSDQQESYHQQHHRQLRQQQTHQQTQQEQNQQQEQILLRAGDAVIVHHSTVHRVAPNKSPDIRFLTVY